MPLLKLPLPSTMGKMLLMLFLFGVFLFPEQTFGQTELPEPLSPPRLVNDFASLMQPVDVEALEQKLVLYSDCTSNQIGIVTIEALGEYEVADFAQRLGQKWGIGKKDKNNGVLILISKTDRKMTIQTGFGLEGVLPDHICARIIENKLKPNFKQGNYYQGLDEATNEIIGRTIGVFKEEPKADKNESSSFPWVIILIVLVVWAMASGRDDHKITLMQAINPVFWLFWAFTYILGTSYEKFMTETAKNSNSGSSSSGSSNSGSSSSGFSGFGGGSFGGGGASGSW